MKHLFYTTSESAWDGLYHAMQYAEKSIYLEMYIFVDDTEKTNDFIALLVERARKGVMVKIVLDRFGSFGLSGVAQEKLRTAGVELLFFNHIFRRLHRKIVIVDEKIGFVGGVNIHESARAWSDLLIQVEGKIVNSLVGSFFRTYRACGGRDRNVVYVPRHKKAMLGRTRIWLLEHVPYLRRPRLRDAYTEAILRAKYRIVLVTPYFTPSRWLIELLKKSAERKIDVEIIVPHKTDSAFVSRANLRYMNMLASFGVIFFELPRMNHAKLLLIDENLALVGSQNIDALSFDFNVEVGLFFSDPKMISDLIAIIDGWKKESMLFTPSSHVSLFDRVLSIFVRLLQPFL